MKFATLTMPVVYCNQNGFYRPNFLDEENKKGLEELLKLHQEGFKVSSMSSAVLHDVIWNSYYLIKEK